jgi:hypothetical protein
MTEETTPYRGPGDQNVDRNSCGARLANVPVGQTLGGGQRQASRIDLVNNTAGNICEVVGDLQNRLRKVVDRIDGSRPMSEEEACDVDAPGIFGEIESRHRATQRDLERCLGWISELERLL